MEKKEQVRQWVQNKLGKVLDEDLKLKIVDENSTFDIEAYINYLQDKFLNEKEVRNLEKSLNTSSYYDLYFFESENSSEGQNSIQNSLGIETNEYQNFPVEEIIKNLGDDSEEVRTKFLKVLELSAEDLIGQNFLHKIVEILQKNLNLTENREVIDLILKVFQKLLKCPKNPLTICKGFTSIAEVVTNQIDTFNQKVSNPFEKIYDIKKEKWIGEKKLPNLEGKSSQFLTPEILIKLMWLLLDCQQQIRTKGLRFNETRYRDVIFSFIHLLNSTTVNTENPKLTGLELVSVLDPKANWCRYWCHTAVGRTLLCSALRKYKNFLIHIIEVMLNHMKVTKSTRLPSVSKSVSLTENSQKFETKSYNKILDIGDSTKKFYRASVVSGPQRYNLKKEINKTKKRDLEWIIQWIPCKVVDEAVFLHSVSLVSCLIQFRSGRALFPVPTATKKRLLNVQDLSLSIIEHIENFEYKTQGNATISYISPYHAKILEILKTLKTPINSSRVSTER